MNKFFIVNDPKLRTALSYDQQLSVAARSNINTDEFSDFIPIKDLEKIDPNTVFFILDQFDEVLYDSRPERLKKAIESKGNRVFMYTYHAKDHLDFESLLGTARKRLIKDIEMIDDEFEAQ